MGEQKRSIPAIIFSIIAICSGLSALAIALIQGRRAGWENMMIYSSPAVVAAIIAIIIRRSALTIIAAVAGLLAVAALFLGS